MAHGVSCAILFVFLVNAIQKGLFIDLILESDNCTATCKSGSCIHEEWICDREEDCSDGSDEMDCGTLRCSAGHILCTRNNTCIPEVWGCDGANDCADGEDEMDCDDNFCDGQFQCKDNNRCISMEWRCDFEPDCDDGSDEADCEGHLCPELQCLNGRCILESWKCDGDRDCHDGSDEANCTYSPDKDDCESDSFKCSKSGECIHKAWKCDGEFDCLDHSDEDDPSCSNNKCKDAQFPCSDNKTCIPAAFRCDSVPDCLDGSDESDCPKEEVACSYDEFKCSGVVCIDKQLLCNKHNDCTSGEDEEEGLCSRLKCKGSNCSHTCIEWHDQPLCTCPHGMQISKDNKTCEDVNECLDAMTCSHICINKPEGRGHKCLCHPGYEMEWSTLRCKAAEGEPSLFFANQHDLREVGLRSGVYKSIVGRLHTAVAIDYDYQEDFVYWSDVSEETISRMPLHSQNVNSMKEEVASDVSSPDRLAFDWIHKNLYWTDTGRNQIEVASVQDLGQSPWRTVLFAGKHDEPQAIALDPRPGRWYLFWSDWGVSPRIERSFLDGSGRKTVVSENILWPNGLTMDYEMDRIYWIDAKFHSIFSANYDGGDRRLVLYSAFYVRHPFAMAFFEDEIYWSDWETEAIYKVPNYLSPGEARSEVREVAHKLHLPMGVHIHHRLKQPIAENACKNSGCHQLCLPRSGGASDARNFTCACSSRGFRLAFDGRSCIAIGPSNFARPSTTFDQKLSGVEKGSTRPLPEPTEGPLNFFLEGQRHHKRAIGFIVCIFITASTIIFLIILLLYCSHKKKTPKVLNFDNPVYRRTTDDTLVLQRNQKSVLLSPPLLQPLTAQCKEQV